MAPPFGQSEFEHCFLQQIQTFVSEFIPTLILIILCGLNSKNLNDEIDNKCLVTEPPVTQTFGV